MPVKNTKKNKNKERNGNNTNGAKIWLCVDFFAWISQNTNIQYSSYTILDCRLLRVLPINYFYTPRNLLTKSSLQIR